MPRFAFRSTHFWLRSYTFHAFTLHTATLPTLGSLAYTTTHATVTCHFHRLRLHTYVRSHGSVAVTALRFWVHRFLRCPLSLPITAFPACTVLRLDTLHTVLRITTIATIGLPGSRLFTVVRTVTSRPHLLRSPRLLVRTRPRYTSFLRPLRTHLAALPTYVCFHLHLPFFTPPCSYPTDTFIHALPTTLRSTRFDVTITTVFVTFNVITSYRCRTAGRFPYALPANLVSFVDFPTRLRYRNSVVEFLTFSLR